MDEAEQRIGLRLRLWISLLRASPTNLRQKAVRLMRKGDDLRQQGRHGEARILYDHALDVTNQIGVHHVRKKVLKRLDSF